MAVVRINEKAIRTMDPPPKGNAFWWDDTVRGFGVRVTAAGAKAFVFRYRVAATGKDRVLTIGKVADWTATAARDRAEGYRRLVVQGADPAQDRADERAAPTINTLCDRYIKEHAEPEKRASSVKDDKRMVEIIKQTWKGRTVVSITRDDVKALHRAHAATPYAANRLLSLLSKMFSLASRDWNMRQDNPARGVKRFTEEPRERYLDTEELGRLAEAMDKAPERIRRSADAIRLIVLTGARKGEVLNARWDQFDLESGVWVKPSAHTKANRVHRVPLSDAAVSLLRGIKEDAPVGVPWVFPGNASDEDGQVKPLSEIKRAWGSLCDAANLEGVRIHDLRHTYASALVSSGQTLEVIGRLLGHTQVNTSKRYAHLMDAPLRSATEAFAGTFNGKGKSQ